MRLKNKLKTGIAMMGIVSLLIPTFTACTKSDDNNDDVSQNENESAQFKPRLDTDKEVTLDAAGFFGNFEALEEVINNFNEYYPNVTILYEQNGSDMLREYMNNNVNNDIFMVSNDNIDNKDDKEKWAGDYCLNLSDEDIDFSDIKDANIEDAKVDGNIIRIPIGQSLCGMNVNKTLLEKEGLSVPENYEQFMDVLKKLKDKGYTPIQGAVLHSYYQIVTNMAMCIASDDKDIMSRLENKDASVADEFKPVYDKLFELIDKGYMSLDVNSTYPEDNYDQAILTFFEGKVPFWICNTECAGGMKKRESKSEAFTKNPFEYEFMYVPLGENGVYEYSENWYSIAVNKNSDNRDYAVEFIRFLVRSDQLNTLAGIKGVPSIAKETDDEKYAKVRDVKNIQESFINDGSVGEYIKSYYLKDTCTKIGMGKIKDSDAAVEELRKLITK